MKPPSILDDSDDPGIFGDLPSVATQPRDGADFSPLLKILLGVLAALAILFVPIIGLILAALIVICWLLWRIAQSIEIVAWLPTNQHVERKDKTNG